MSKPLLVSFEEGSRLVEVVKHLSQNKIDRFGTIAGGVGAIHLDKEFCNNTRFKSTLVQGYLLIGYISEMMKNNFGKPWFISGDMEVKLVGPVKPGDTVITKGVVREIVTAENKTDIICQVWVDNHLGEKAVVGEATLSL